jgi:hypothetical protein
MVVLAVLHEHHPRSDAEIVGGQGGVTVAKLHPGEDLGPHGAQRRVPERGQHVVVARQHPAPERIRPIHGVSSPHPVIDGVGVLEERGVSQRVRFGLRGEHGLVLLFHGKLRETGSVNALEASSCSLLVLQTVCGLSSTQRAEALLGSRAITPPHPAQEEW